MVDLRHFAGVAKYIYIYVGIRHFHPGDDHQFLLAVLYGWSHDCLVVSVRESQHDLNSGLGIIVICPDIVDYFFFQIYLLVVRSFKFSMFKHVGRDLPERSWKYINGW